jgi:uncharacterized protein
VIFNLKRGIPSREGSLSLLRRVGLDQRVIQHSIAVSRTSLEIANKMHKNGVNVDINLVEAGALLHDIGRSRAHGIAHGRVGAELLRELGYPDALARIAESHVLCGVLTYKAGDESNTKEKSRTPMTVEEKIVCYADKITLENKRTTLRERYDRWFRKYGKNSTLTRAFYRSKEIETELDSLSSQKQSN